MDVIIPENGIVRKTVCELTVNSTFADYDIDTNAIAKGAYGKVFRATRLKDGEEVAMKFFGYLKNKPDFGKITHEIMLMTELMRADGGQLSCSLFRSHLNCRRGSVNFVLFR
jgi:hypothetical protein